MVLCEKCKAEIKEAAPEIYDAVCTRCGKKTTVPFKPREGWEVLCRECYEKKKRRQE